MQCTHWALNASKYLVILGFVLAVYAALAQFSGIPSLAGSAFRLAYFAFPFLILSILLAVYAHSWAVIRRAWRKKRLKWLSWLAGIGYALFYVFVTSTISVPDGGVPVPSNLSHGYVILFEAYGPMTVWPDVEFYFPGVNLVGYLSVGNVLLLVSLGLLTAFAVTLLLQNVSIRRSINRGVGTSFVGAFLTALSTNACCCCTPIILPVLAIFFGGTLPSAMAESLINPQSPVSNLLVLANLASLLTSVIVSTKGCCRL